MRGVLIVDQSPSVARDIAAACQAAGLPVLGVARDGLEAVQMAQHARPSHITLDLILPRLSGLQVMQTLGRQGVAATVIVVSAVTARDPIMAARQAGAHAYLLKPLTVAKLVELLRETEATAPAAAAR